MLAPIGSRAFSMRETAFEMWPPRDDAGDAMAVVDLGLGEADAVDRHRVERLRRPVAAEHEQGVVELVLRQLQQLDLHVDARVAEAVEQRQRGARALLGDVQVERDVERAQEAADREPVGGREVDRRAEALGQQRRRRRDRERPEVEEDRVLDLRAEGVVVEERRGVGGLDQRRRAEGAVAERVVEAEPERVEVRVRQPLAAEAGVEERQRRRRCRSGPRSRCACWCRSCGSCACR